MVALWGRVEDATGEETLETHGVTMARREAVSRWLEAAVGPRAKADMDTAALGSNTVAGAAARLSAGQFNY